ncbi:unnamed protein product, partial [Mycena citricolor]
LPTTVETVMNWLTTIASIGMAVGPPLTYVDQAYSIVRKKDSTGFSRDVCAILLIANITRCFFWLGNHFEIALLLALLYICIIYRPKTSAEVLGGSKRPLSFWQWPTYIQHLEFLAGLIILQAILFLVFGRFELYVSLLGFLALGLESTLPIPQLISNYKQRSLYGFRMSTLVGWAGGDLFKTAYFFMKATPLQFTICAVFQLSVDFAIVIQRIVYGVDPPPTVLADDEDLEQALALAEE